MFHISTKIRLTFLLTFLLLITATATNAALLNCDKSLAVELTGEECNSVVTQQHVSAVAVLQDAVPARSTNVAFSGYHVEPSPSAIPESAPLLILIVALLAVLLVRAKRFNTK